MRKIVAIGGEPASGKTTLVKQLIERLCPYPMRKFEYGLLRGHIDQRQKVIVLGLYEPGQTFAGTDRLSMAVMRDAKAFLENHRAMKLGDYAVVFEGDRLFTRSFLETCIEHSPTEVFVVKASPVEIEKRHRRRGDSQTPSWLLGRKTKVEAIMRSGIPYAVLENETLRDSMKHADTLFQTLSQRAFAISPA